MTDETKEVACCKNCFYVQRRIEPAQHQNTIGVVTDMAAFYCRRYPPSTIGIIRVSHDGWCGEWHEKLGAKEDDN